MKFNDFLNLDLNIKKGLVLAFLLLIASVVSFIYAYANPKPTDAFSMFIFSAHYFLFAICIVGLFSIGGLTAHRYHKQKG